MLNFRQLLKKSSSVFKRHILFFKYEILIFPKHDQVLILLEELLSCAAVLIYQQGVCRQR